MSNPLLNESSRTRTSSIKLNKVMKSVDFKIGQSVKLVGTQGYVIYTNPNNVNSYAYTAIGYDCKDVKRNAKEYPGSCKILFSGRGQKSFDKSVELTRSLGYSIK